MIGIASRLEYERRLAFRGGGHECEGVCPPCVKSEGKRGEV